MYPLFKLLQSGKFLADEADGDADAKGRVCRIGRRVVERSASIMLKVGRHDRYAHEPIRMPSSLTSACNLVRKGAIELSGILVATSLRKGFEVEGGSGRYGVVAWRSETNRLGIPG